MCEGGESRSQTNVNYLLEQYGISVNSGLLCAVYSVTSIQASDAQVLVQAYRKMAVHVFANIRH